MILSDRVAGTKPLAERALFRARQRPCSANTARVFTLARSRPIIEKCAARRAALSPRLGAFFICVKTDMARECSGGQACLIRRADRSCFQNKITAEVFRFVREYFLPSSSVGMTCGRFAVGARLLCGMTADTVFARGKMRRYRNIKYFRVQNSNRAFNALRSDASVVIIKI